MSIFSKTTGIDFQTYGEVFNETTFKNKFEEGRFYMTVEEKESNKFYKNDSEFYLTVREGIAAIAITEDLNKKPKKATINRSQHLQY